MTIRKAVWNKDIQSNTLFSVDTGSWGICLQKNKSKKSAKWTFSLCPQEIDKNKGVEVLEGIAI
ncbi:hypothetical protein [Paenibacillus sp. UNC451MF]|uniref:hypothetical protein n=1 Tax=Paenibacillus sp. UNC451MF TaxID=1449063 RepID=UPI00048B1FD3|nr:hypothetical protein [Paenibacillus sp. UNC451MF]